MECGDAFTPAVLMIHRMGIMAEHSFGYVVEHLKDTYHIFLMCLDG